MRVRRVERLALAPLIDRGASDSVRGGVLLRPYGLALGAAHPSSRFSGTGANARHCAASGASTGGCFDRRRQVIGLRREEFGREGDVAGDVAQSRGAVPERRRGSRHGWASTMRGHDRARSTAPLTRCAHGATTRRSSRRLACLRYSSCHGFICIEQLPAPSLRTVGASPRPGGRCTRRRPAARVARPDASITLPHRGRRLALTLCAARFRSAWAARYQQQRFELSDSGMSIRSTRQRRRKASGSARSSLVVMTTIGGRASSDRALPIGSLKATMTERVEQAVGDRAVGLVDLVDEQHRRRARVPWLILGLRADARGPGPAWRAEPQSKAHQSGPGSTKFLSAIRFNAFSRSVPSSTAITCASASRRTVSTDHNRSRVSVRASTTCTLNARLSCSAARARAGSFPCPARPVRGAADGSPSRPRPQRSSDRQTRAPTPSSRGIRGSGSASPCARIRA